MNLRLQDVLEGTHGNYILPLVWQRGEEEAVIREEMARIDKAGIKAVCIESRPHPDMLGPGWWKDMDIIMDEARRRNMKVWVFDDNHFPTGNANGRLKEAPDELRRVFVAERHIDALGPVKEASFLINPWLSEGEVLEAVVAARREGADDTLAGEFIDLMPFVQGGVLYWDIPDGLWRVFLIVRTTAGQNEKYKDYINPLAADSVRVLIDACYVPYYERYRNDFGGTFAGFFSDEPGFYNDKATYDFESKLGKKGVVLPWTIDLLSLLEAEFGATYRNYLPLLWHEAGSELTGAVRFAYMNVVSRLYAEHFSGQIGAWCREHRVEYIGHVIEDNNVHARLGCGPGHFFRALSGQDMSGVDVVLWQLVPGFDEAPFTWIAGQTDSEFFHYGLAKLASSLGHIDPKKKGRTMAEVFGAYGWAEGLKLMKWLTDHMLVRGVNYFVPHSFSQKEFPDSDCPPHLYARGQNPQYRYYRVLNDYTNRMSHLLTGGRHRATTAVLYHAEAEWSGSFMYFHKPVKELMRSQIDCDILPIDAIVESAEVADGRLKAGAEDYGCLIVPYAEALPAKLLLRLAVMADQGLPLLFIDGLPKRSSEGADVSATLARLSAQPSVHLVSLSELVIRVKELGFSEVTVENEEPYLRYYHYEHSDLDVYVFFNEHPTNAVDTTVRLPVRGTVLAYDALLNKIFPVSCEEAQEGASVSLRLSPYESIVYVAGEGLGNMAATLESRGMFPQRYGEKNEFEINGPWTISTATSVQYPAFVYWGTAERLENMSRVDKLPRFSGTFRYETEFELDDPAGVIRLDLGDVYETAEVWVNGQSAGVRICPPYCLEISGLIQKGNNTLTIEVTNTLVKEQRDFLSRFAQQEPSGLLGPVRLIGGDL